MNGREMVEAVFGEATTQQALFRLTPQEEARIAKLVGSVPIEQLCRNIGIELGRHVSDVLEMAGVRPSAFAHVESIYEQLVKRVVEQLSADTSPVRTGYTGQVGSRG